MQIQTYSNVPFWEGMAIVRRCQKILGRHFFDVFNLIPDHFVLYMGGKVVT